MRNCSQHFKVSVAVAIVLSGSVSLGVDTALSQDGLKSTGLIFDSPAQIERLPKAKRYRDFTPPKIDLTKYAPVPGSQGEHGSCVGWAVAYAARTMHFVWDNKGGSRNSTNIASPAALYNSVYDRDNCKDGTRISDALQFMKMVGVPSVADFPFNSPGNCFRKVMDSEYKSAERFKIRDFYFISPPNDVTRVRSQLAQFKPVVLSMYVPDSFHRKGGSRVFTDTRLGEDPDGHAVTAIGYDDNMPGGGAFKIINSWGRNWGNGGFRWISYGAFSELIKGAYVMETRPLDRPKPRPTPEPPLVIESSDSFEIAKAVLQGFECSGISHFDSDRKMLAAFVKSDDDKTQASTKLSEKIVDFEISIDVAPFPQCEAMQTLEKQLADAQGLELLVNGKTSESKSIAFEEGDPFVIEVTTPDFPAYLYAAYLETDDDGHYEVIHLIQSTSPLDQYAPRSKIILGDGKEGRDEYEILGPNFGREMVVVIASASPLYEEPRPWEEIERDYLSGIRDALIRTVQGKGERQIAAKVLPITTRAKQ